MTLDVVFSEDPRDFLRRDWSDLVRLDPAGTIFHTPDFLKLYWEEFGEEPDHLLLAFGEDAGTQVAAAAFERIEDTLRFLGGTEVTDYLGPVGRPEVATAFSDRLWAELLDRADWRTADLRGLPEGSAWLPALRDAAVAHGLAVEETEDQNGVAPFLELPATWDALPPADPVEAPPRDPTEGEEARGGGGPGSGSRPRRAEPCCRSSIGSWSCTG